MNIGILQSHLGVNAPDEKTKKLAGAAEQFESLMIGQLLESVTQAEGECSASALDMGKQQMAQAIAAGGGLGLKRMILDSMNRETTAPPPGTLRQ